MKAKARKSSVTLPGVLGTARVGEPASALVARLRAGDVAVIDQVDLDRDTARSFVEAGVAAVVNAAPMVSGRYANLGPELLAEAGVVLVDRVGREGVDRIHDDLRVRLHDGVVYAAASDGEGEELARGRVVDLEQVHGQMEQPPADLAVTIDGLARTTGEFLQRERALLLDGRGLPMLSTKMSGRSVVVVGAVDHADLKAVGAYVREQAPVVIAVGRAADDLLGLSWVPDVVIVTAGDPGSVPSSDALRVAADVVLVAPPGAGRAEQATIETVAGPPSVVETSAGAEDVGLLLAGRYDASLVIAVGLRSRLEELVEGGPDAAASTLGTRLLLGDRLVDAAAVRMLYTGRPGALQLFALVLAGLVALLAAIAVTPLGQEWGNDVIDYLGGLT